MLRSSVEPTFSTADPSNATLRWREAVNDPNSLARETWYRFNCIPVRLQVGKKTQEAKMADLEITKALGTEKER